jgi:UDP-N-acetylmuramate dehydrogenase
LFFLREKPVSIGSLTGDISTAVRIERDYPLSKLTTIGVGGPADRVAFCRSASEIREAIELCRSEGVDYFVLGGGSNVLASDGGYRGMIILDQIEDFSIDGEVVTCGAGLSLHTAVERVAEAGLEGMESLAGIAGTIGGAIAGNAGAYGRSVADVLVDVELYHPEKGFYTQKSSELDFRYRHSRIKCSGEAIIKGRFKLKHADADELKGRVNKVLDERWKKLPREDISAGCFFKNIEKADAPFGKLAAGKLLDDIGAKQICIGKAGVYPNHANVLINKGGATASEIRQLSLELKRKVKETFNIDLVEEVVLLGDFS